MKFIVFYISKSKLLVILNIYIKLIISKINLIGISF